MFANENLKSEEYMKNDDEEAPLQQATSTTLSSISNYLLARSESQDSLSNMPVISVPLVCREQSSFQSTSNTSVASYDTFDTVENSNIRYIRFQVVIWYVGRPDEVLGKVDMKFRVTIFWNAPNDDDLEVGYGMNNPYNKRVWKMHGRQRAYRTELTEVGENDKICYVPPVSILNAVDHEMLGEPEVCLLNTEENLMKWSCLYKASLLQYNIQVAEFPHDSHDLILRLGILKHRQPRKRWDKGRWKLDLASREDVQGTIEIPHGAIVDHVKVPGFSYGTEGLQFEFLPLEFGSYKGTQNRDQCLQVKLKLTRESSYYDRNIIPLLAALNTVGICTLALNAASFGARGEMILAIAFVEIGIRMTVDSRLPVVGYQIKMQWVLNNYFFGLLFLVAESSIAYLLQQNGHDGAALGVDRFAAVLEAVHMLIVLIVYINGSGTFMDNMCWNCFDNRLRYD